MTKARKSTAAGRATKGALLLSIVLVGTAAALGGGLASAEDGAVSDVRKYCTNVATAAIDARFAWQTAKLNEVDERIKSRIKDLGAREDSLRSWIEKRKAMQKQASEKLVGIYAKMRPETAATQINLLEDEMAAAVLGELNPRQASAIFNEIVPERAAKLAGMIVGGSTTNEKKL